MAISGAGGQNPRKKPVSTNRERAGDCTPKGCKLHCKNQGGPGAVRFSYGLGVERFGRLRFLVRTVPLGKKGFSLHAMGTLREVPPFQFRFRLPKHGSGGSGLGSWKTGSGGFSEFI